MSVSEKPLSWIHIVGLSAIAVAYPIFHLLARNPEFFVAHHAGSTEILIVVASLILVVPGIPIAVVWLAGLAGPRVRTAVLGAVLAMLAGVLAMQVLKQAGVETWRIAVPIAAGAGVAAAVAYHLFAPIRTFVTLLSVAGVIVPALFLSTPEIRRMIVPNRPRPSEPAQSDGATRATRGAAPNAPVVMVVFDEMPLVSLLDADRKIDPVLYPNLAGLARAGVWYRNATTVSNNTRAAVPAIVSGLYPRTGLVPVYTDHPATLFTLLGATHRLEVIEAITELCPPRLCPTDVEPLRARLAAMADDLRIVAVHIVLTDDLKKGLPTLTAGWAGFGYLTPRERRHREGEGRPSTQRSKKEVALSFVDEIASDDPQPTFHFLHSMLSHHPHIWLPSGQRSTRRAAVSAEINMRWIDDEWAVAQQYQRHLLQMGLVDFVVGRLVDRLKAIQLYDRALVVVVSDHGISFRPGGPLRLLTDENAAEILRVPLIIKFPAGVGVPGPMQATADGQHVSDRNVETVDIAPTIADALGLPMPWRVDGASLLNGENKARASKRFFPGFRPEKSTRLFGPDGPDPAPALQRKLEIFGGADNYYRVPRVPRFGALVGRRLSELRVETGGGAVEVDFVDDFATVARHADKVPFEITGRVIQGKPGGAPTFIAVAINGTVATLTRTWDSVPRGWLATPPLTAWREGRNDVSVFVLDTDDRGPLLRRTVRPARRERGRAR